MAVLLLAASPQGLSLKAGAAISWSLRAALYPAAQCVSVEWLASGWLLLWPSVKGRPPHKSKLLYSAAFWGGNNPDSYPAGPVEGV